jgi:hypothetical protein
MRVISDMVLNTDYIRPDKLRLTFEMDLPAHLYQPWSLFSQYAQILPGNETAANHPFDSVACVTEIPGDTTQEPHREVFNYEGFTRLDDNTAVDRIFRIWNSEEKITDGRSGEFNLTSDPYLNMPYPSFIEGNMVLPCVVELEIPKIDRDFSIFRDYKVIVGARFFPEDQATESQLIEERKMNFNLTQPDYSNDVVDEEFVEAFSFIEEDLDEEFVEKEIQPLKSTEVDVDTSTIFGYRGEAKQHMFAAYEVNERVDLDDLLNFYFEIDMP